MIEVSELFMRTAKGVIHSAMTDDTGNVYAWKRCRLSKEKVAIEVVDRTVISNADAESLCQICTRGV